MADKALISDFTLHGSRVPIVNRSFRSCTSYSDTQRINGGKSFNIRLHSAWEQGSDREQVI